ncbi:MAG: hypothetical protein WCL06_01620 [Bacteroidota bacterium]
MTVFIFSILISFQGWGQSLLVEDFTGLTVGANLAGQSTWAKFGSGPDATIGNATPLTYTNYNGGGAEYVIMPSPSATTSKVTKALGSSPAPGTNTFYYSFLLKLTSTSTPSGNYFLSLGDPGTGTVYFARLFAQTNGAGYNIGVSKLSNTATYGTTVLNLNQTYLVVVRYDFVAGATNDPVYVWVNPALTSEPSTSSAEATVSSGTDPTPATVGNFHWHNRGVTNPVGAFDGIRVAYGANSAAAWTNLSAYASGSTPSIVVNPATLNGFSYVQGSGPSSEYSFSVSGSSLTSNISIAPPTNYEISTGTGGAFSATNPIILTQSGGSVVSTTIYVRLKSGLTANNYNGEVITATSTGATNGTITCNGTVLSAPTPVISVLPTALSGFSTVVGVASTSQPYTIGGDYLIDDVTVTAPANFEVSTDDINFSPSIILPQSGGNITGEPVTVHVRIAASAVAGPVSGNIVHSSSTAVSVNLALTGTVLYAEPSNQAANFQVTAPSYSSITLTWADNDGVQPATGFLILANTTGVFTPPVDGVAQTNDYNLSDGSGVANVLHGVQTFTWTGLLSSTHYYFEIYAYTNSGININYKLVPAAPAGDVTTQVFVQPLAAWTFDATPVAPNTPSSLAANFGIQANTAMLYADGTNGSSTWITATTGNELTAFSGTTLNDPREGANVLAGYTYSMVAGTGTSANGKSMVIKFSMTNYKDPILTFATRGTTTGFSSQLWEWSTDNITYTPFGTNTAVTTTNFLTKTLDMSGIDQLDNAATVYLRVTFSGATNATGNNRIDNIVIRGTEIPTTKTINAKVFLEGLYNVNTGLMNQAQDYAGGSSVPKFAAGIADQVTLELHNGSSPYDIAFTYPNVDVNVNGTFSVNTIPGTITGSYYIVIKHRNSIDTWSNLPVDFGAASPILYDFTTAASQSYGDNLKLVGSVYAMYSGNATQDVAVDASDLAAVDNAATGLLKGYYPEDVNGDGLVDATDMALVDNNVTAIIQVKRP